jgi:hypothetical protein
MKIIPVRQGTEEWLRARAGIPTASCFGRVVTPGGKPSAQARAYGYQLVAERITGLAGNEIGSDWMVRGSALEAEAVAWYELERGVTTTEVGLVTTDDGRWGCSPDRLVGERGLLELKCPSAAVHIGYLLDGLGKDYRPQVQGQLLVTGRHFVDFVSYCPGLPPYLYTTGRDIEYQETLAQELDAFSIFVDGSEKIVRGCL